MHGLKVVELLPLLLLLFYQLVPIEPNKRENNWNVSFLEEKKWKNQKKKEKLTT